MLIFHDPRSVEYERAGHPERPARISQSEPFLRLAHPSWEWRAPDAATEAMLLRAHSGEHLKNVRVPKRDFDADSPAYPNIYEHAARAAGSAVAVTREALAGRRAFSLMRPPGHHATRERAMGFCYFNHIAVAAFDALEQGATRVGIWDFDAHHGNGTEAILANNKRVTFASIHQYPAYPGTGGRSFANIHNFPVAPLTARGAHMREIKRGLQTLVDARPDLILVSAGFDAYARDPITQMTLEEEDFFTLGSWLRETDIPSTAILEGGYSDELPRLIDVFLRGWNADDD